MSKDEERYDVSQYEGHAEGPWAIECYERAWHIYGWKGDDYVCYLNGTAQRKNPTAKLLAAAPEILDALKKAYERIDDLEENIEHGLGVFEGYLQAPEHDELRSGLIGVARGIMLRERKPDHDASE